MFFGYFLIAFYAGGNAYLKAYGDVFHVNFISDPTSPEIVSIFINEVLSSGQYFALVILSIVIVVIYAFAKFVFRFWFSFLIVTASLITSLVAFSSIGRTTGELAAERDKMNSSELPEIRLILSEDLDLDLESGGWRLLHSDEDFMFVVEEQGVEGGLTLVHAIRREIVVYYEVMS